MLGYDFHRQKPIDNYILDFFCHELMLGIEIDGYSHELLEFLIRTQRINDIGITILRFSDYQIIKDMENVLRCIEQFNVDFEEDKTHP